MFRFLTKRFAAKVLDVDSTSSASTTTTHSQIEFLKDFLSKHKYIFSRDFEENLAVLKRKHLVDSFLITQYDGSVLVSSEGNGHSEGMVGTAMLSYIKSEMPDSESVLVKRRDGWFMLFPLEKKVCIVKAGSELSNIELRALAFELDTLMKENQHEKATHEKVSSATTAAGKKGTKISA